jgi:tripartite-type tricarboxylate transporter receptor subunit TctC
VNRAARGEEEAAMRRSTRRHVLGAAACVFVAPPGRALAYPDRAVRLVVPWPPGAFTDVSARALAQIMTGTLGQPVVVENRAGASGSIGAEAVARAAPDGYTLLVGSAEPCAINALVSRRLPYDPVTDFAPISLYARVPAALAVGPSLREVADFDGFLEAVRAAPGRITFGSWGIASVSHLTMEALNRASGLRMLHVPFSGAAPAITAVAAGQVDAMFLLAGTAMGAARGGRVRILALAAGRRAAPMPEVPTLRERGVAVEGGNWFALLGPARMPEPAVHRIAASVAEALRTPAIQDLFRAQAAEPSPSTPEALRDFIAADRERWGEVIRALNIQLE